MAANQSQSDAEQLFAAWFAENYPEGSTITDPNWHAPRILRKAKLALQPSAPAAEYAAKNPLGGPARMFEAIASRIRAGEDYYEVLRDYDLQHISRATASNERAVALKCATICMNIGSMLKMEHQKYAKYANPEGARQLHAMHDTGAFRCAEAIRAYAASLSETATQGTAKDAARLDYLDREANSEPLLLHSLGVGERNMGGFRGLGLRCTGRSLRQAIDDMMAADGDRTKDLQRK